MYVRANSHTYRKNIFSLSCTKTFKNMLSPFQRCTTESYESYIYELTDDAKEIFSPFKKCSIGKVILYCYA